MPVGQEKENISIIKFLIVQFLLRIRSRVFLVAFACYIGSTLHDRNHNLLTTYAHMH